MSDSETETELDAADTDGPLRKFGLRKNVLLSLYPFLLGHKEREFPQIENPHVCNLWGCFKIPLGRHRGKVGVSRTPDWLIE